jgi:hypothetical protein
MERHLCAERVVVDKTKGQPNRHQVVWQEFQVQISPVIDATTFLERRQHEGTSRRQPGAWETLLFLPTSYSQGKRHAILLSPQTSDTCKQRAGLRRAISTCWAAARTLRCSLGSNSCKFDKARAAALPWCHSARELRGHWDSVTTS